MGTAYTPGLKITANTLVRKTRRLPLKGEVLVGIGDAVEFDTVVARTKIPGAMQTAKVAHELGIEPGEVEAALLVKVGDRVEAGQTIASIKSFFGLFKSECKAPISGTVELISPVTGHVGIRENPDPIEIRAYVHGRVAEVIPQEGVVVETHGALVQGIFGIGGERQGEIQVVASSPDDPLEESAITEAHRGKVIVGGSIISAAALRKAAACGVAGVVVGGVVDRDLVDLLGYDIGVAITGQEQVGFTLILTEGFGRIRMADRTFRLLKSLEGRLASINGATQIRAGVIRPEIVVSSSETIAEEASASQELTSGTHIRMIREPYFGLLGSVVSLPSELQLIESGAKVRVLEARLEDGRTVTVPRANVEIIQG